MPGTRVFDLALRVFHGGLAVAFTAAWLTGGHPPWLYWHVAAGWAVSALLLFRLIWFQRGPDTARWRALLVPYARVRAHAAALLRGHAPAVLGHNPIGAWAAVAGLAGLAGLVLTGVITQGGEEGHGPLAGIPVGAGLAAHTIHTALAWLTLLWVGAHLVGIAKESALRRANLARAMVDGRQPGTRPEGDVRPFRGVAAALGMALGVGAGAVAWAPAQATPDHPFVPYRSELPQDEAWNDACGDCHLAFHPSLLPARGWERLLDGQHDHFGEDLYFSEAELAPLRAWARTHAAEAGESEHAVRIAASGESATRITELGWWKDVHSDLAEADFSANGVDGRADCAACHRDAASGAFEDGAMHIP